MVRPTTCKSLESAAGRIGQRKLDGMSSSSSMMPQPGMAFAAPGQQRQQQHLAIQSQPHVGMPTPQMQPTEDAMASGFMRQPQGSLMPGGSHGHLPRPHLGHTFGSGASVVSAPTYDERTPRKGRGRSFSASSHSRGQGVLHVGACSGAWMAIEFNRLLLGGGSHSLKPKEFQWHNTAGIPHVLSPLDFLSVCVCQLKCINPHFGQRNTIFEFSLLLRSCSLLLFAALLFCMAIENFSVPCSFLTEAVPDLVRVRF